jgi:phosphotransferase system HPr-like phosphotransfer protein
MRQPPFIKEMETVLENFNRLVPPGYKDQGTTVGGSSSMLIFVLQIKKIGSREVKTISVTGRNAREVLAALKAETSQLK